MHYSENTMIEQYPQPLDLTDINLRVADRSEVFYWQTDRRVSVEEAGRIWVDRHHGLTDERILAGVNSSLIGDQILSIEPTTPDSQTNLGNISSVRIVKLESKKGAILRCFPLGIKNGYFHVESLVAAKIKSAGLPSYETYAVHDLTDTSDFSYHLIEQLPGFAITRWLEAYPGDEQKVLHEIGATMAKMHQVSVDGFGPFDNNLAKQGILKGRHSSLSEALNASLEDNLQMLVKEDVFTSDQMFKILSLFKQKAAGLTQGKAVLVHNDFADWNLLTNGEQITGIIDLDECIGGDPVSDIACWSTFFDPDRLEGMLKGYWSVTDKPTNYEDKFQLLRLRYTISKMTLRLRRYKWEPSEAVKEKIEIGRRHLAESLQFYEI